MSIHMVHSALHAMAGCTAVASRDGVLLTTPDGMTHDIVTCRSDESLLLASVEAFAAALRARGAKPATLAAPTPVPAPVQPLAFTSALPVANMELPPDVVINGGKVTEVTKVETPSWNSPKKKGGK